MTVYPLSKEHSFTSPKGSQFVLKQDSVILQAFTPLCPRNFAITLIPESDLKVEQGVAQIFTSSLNGKILGDIKKDEQGFSYFCAQ